ncbi:hypothetical protein Pcinc_000831 [Petrolisthes cinctipes]|uniref:Endonuclease/exonuclease/phosphatase domain-containing protein n=1 Tax=Petrolisthes cinctipes TaxID=88211 RepID=A0AAE1GPG4_PETCI|nr:hypothetical protein Pcinc_000831 [Petrolisthes cinctipes]
MNFSTCMDAITAEITKLECPQPTVIINGDFNLPNVNWTTTNVYGGTSSGRLQANILFSLSEQIFSKQVINIPTRQNNILDLFFTTNEELINDIHAEQTLMSDHKVLVVNTTLRMAENPIHRDNENTPTKSFKQLNFSHEEINWSCINEQVNNIKWEEKIRNLDPDQMYTQILTTLLNICDTHIPKRVYRKRRTKIPRDRKILMRKRTKLSKKLAKELNT